MHAFDFDHLLRQLRKRGRPYYPFLDEKTMSMGIYRLGRGEVDRQSPHDQDEVYYIIEGTGTFESRGADGEMETTTAKAGSIIFVRAHVEHRFRDIEKDLTMLVFFSKAEVSKAPPRGDDPK